MTRRVGRLGPLSMCLLACALAGPAAARADTEIQAPTAFNVDGGSVTTPALEAGKTYRLVAFGTFQEVGPNITYDYDAVYCFGDNATIATCRDEPFQTNNSLWAEYQGASGAPFHQLAGSVPAYDSSHSYSITFTAAASTPLRLYAHLTELNRDYPGQLGVALYRIDGPAPCSGRAFMPLQVGCGPTVAQPYDEPPAMGTTASYLPPANGTAVTIVGPPVPKKADSITAIVKSTSDQELLVTKLKEQAAVNAFHLCFITGGSVYLNQGGFDGEAHIGNCLKVTLKVLERCAELKVSRGGPGICGGPSRRTATAAANGCASRMLKLRKKTGRPALRVKCAVTAAGLSISYTDKPGGPSLRKALGTNPSVAVGMPKDAKPVGADDRLNVTWIA